MQPVKTEISYFLKHCIITFVVKPHNPIKIVVIGFAQHRKQKIKTVLDSFRLPVRSIVFRRVRHNLKWSFMG